MFNVWCRLLSKMADRESNPVESPVFYSVPFQTGEYRSCICNTLDYDSGIQTAKHRVIE